MSEPSPAIVDVDGIMGPAETVIQSFQDTDVPTSNQGWYFPSNGVASINGFNKASPIGITAGLYLRIVATKGNGASGSGEFLRVNLFWGVTS